MKKSHLLIVLCVATSLVVVMGCRPAGTPITSEKPIVAKLNTAYPAGMSSEIAVHKLADLAKEKTKGRLIIDVHSGGELYSREEELMALSTGAIQFVATNYAGLAPGFPKVLVLGIPFLWRDYETLRKFQQTPDWRILWETELEKKYGVKTLCYNAPGGAFVVNKVRPITKLTDFKGLKLRAASPIDAGLYKHWGATPVMIPLTELWTALEQGMVDGFTTTFGRFWTSETEVKHGRYALQNSASLVEGWIFVNADWWNSLPDDIRQIMEKEVIPQVERYSNTELEKQTTICINSTKEKGVIWTQFEDYGVVVMSAKDFWDRVMRPMVGDELYKTALGIAGVK